MASHTKGVKRGLFCAQRKKPCKDGNNYREDDPKPWTYQAHHVLCVASVTQFIGKKTALQPIVKQTQWCINDSANVLAMPMWGTVTKFYRLQIGAGDVAAPPPFKNIPIHSYDHGLYQTALDKDLAALASRTEENQEVHKDPSATLKAALNRMRGLYKNDKLLAHGQRGNGTHQEWLEGCAGRPSAQWYLPFSMADTPEPRTFPARRKGALEKVAKLIKNLF